MWVIILKRMYRKSLQINMETSKQQTEKLIDQLPVMLQLGNIDKLEYEYLSSHLELIESSICEEQKIIDTKTKAIRKLFKNHE